jgi:hypothetical protein
VRRLGDGNVGRNLLFHHLKPLDQRLDDTSEALVLPALTDMVSFKSSMVRA